MSITEIGITVSVLSVAIAVLRLNGNNGKLKDFVRRPECHQAQNGIKDKIEDLKGFINIRIDDLKDFIKNGK